MKPFQTNILIIFHLCLEFKEIYIFGGSTEKRPHISTLTYLNFVHSMPNTHPMPYMVFQFDTVTAGSTHASTDADAKYDASIDADATD